MFRYYLWVVGFETKWFFIDIYDRLLGLFVRREKMTPEETIEFIHKYIDLLSKGNDPASLKHLIELQKIVDEMIDERDKTE